MQKLDLTGKTFHRLTVLSESPDRSHGSVKWVCQCTCGNIRVVPGPYLKSGHTKSCGCWKSEKLATATRKHGQASNNGFTGAYKSWAKMRERILCKTANGFQKYGGRGIKICPEWESFNVFFADMGPRPEGHTLDRIDFNGDYSPENCRWADAVQQANNKSNSHFIEWGGKRQTIGQWATELRIPYSILMQRLVTRRWTIEKAMTQPVRRSPNAAPNPAQ